MHTQYLIHGSGVAFVDGGQDEGQFYLAGRDPSLSPPEELETETLPVEMRVEIITSFEMLNDIAQTRNENDFVRINIRGPLNDPHSRYDERVSQWFANPQDESGLEMGETNISLGEVFGLLNGALEAAIVNKIEQGLACDDQRELYRRQKAILALINNEVTA